jgi:hypothetical protein
MLNPISGIDLWEKNEENILNLYGDFDGIRIYN